MSNMVMPDSIDADVRKLLAALGLRSATPVTLLVQPEPGAAPDDCYFNVDAKVAAAGGRKVQGWWIYLFPGMWIEAQFHAVWESPAGGLVDVSPKPDGEREIMFVVDQTRSFAGRSPNNVHVRILDVPAVRAFLSLATLKTDFIEARRIGGSREVALTDADASSLEAAAEMAGVLLLLIRHHGASRNASCPCGSGEKYKRCHEQRLPKLMEALRRPAQ